MQVNSAIEAPDTSRARGTWTTAVYWLLSLGLGGLILATGVGKALDVPGFIGVLHTYRLGLGEMLLWAIGLAVTVFELTLGLWILSGRKLAGAMAFAMALNFGYFVLMTSSLWRGLHLQNCGCYGVYFAQPLRWYSPLEDVALILLSLLLLNIVAGGLRVGRRSSSARQTRKWPQHVQVGEREAGSGAEVLIGDVASPHHRDLVVGGERLVVHAPVDAREVSQEIEPAAVAIDERVVEPHVDVGMRVERGNGGIESLGIEVVEQQAYPHPPLGRLPERLEQHVADVVAVPDEVLHVQRPFCGACEYNARGKRIAGVGQPMDARHSRIRCDARRNRAAESRRRRVDVGGGFDAVLWRGRQRGTTGNEHHAGGQQRGQDAVHLSVTDRCCDNRRTRPCARMSPGRRLRVRLLDRRPHPFGPSKFTTEAA